MFDHDSLEKAFAEARTQAREFIRHYNSQLPGNACPACGEEGHVPGLLCPGCGYRHTVAWLIIRDTEYGYEARSLTSRHQVIAEFNVDDPT